MAGNKHKNGIVCTFPGCDKAMRTQKFKMHFTKTHLKQGELYTVEHRRRFEVVREDSANGGSTPTDARDSESNDDSSALLDAAVATPMAELKTIADLKTEALTQDSMASVQDHDDETASSVDGRDSIKKQEPAIPVSTTSSMLINQAAFTSLLTVPVTSRTKKRSAADASARQTADQTASTLAAYMDLTDRRYNELVGTMNEMIGVQRELLEVLRHTASPPLSEQPAGLALASASALVMAKRQKTSDPPQSSTMTATFI